MLVYYPIRARSPAGSEKIPAGVRNRYKKKSRYKESGSHMIKCLFTELIWSH